MAPAQSSNRSRPAAERPQRRFNSLIPALFFGLPLGLGVLYALDLALPADAVARRYLQHPAERVEVVMFFCALAALASKLLQQVRERLTCRRTLLPAWDGCPVPVAGAVTLLAALQRLPRHVQNTVLGRRLLASLDFLGRRGATPEFDDQLRCLSDNDSVALENSYGLIRFITWAVPILGFLGTVLGITKAIAGVTPERLENDLSSVTDGLAEAFDTTALALALTMLTMALSFIVERLEQGVLEIVDQFIDAQIAHRFERTAPEAGGVLDVVRTNSQLLVGATEQVVQRQADLWAKTLQEVVYRRVEEEKRQQEQFTAALQTALERTLEGHAQQMAALQQHSVEGTGRLLERMHALANAVRDTGREQQAALVRVAEAVAAQAKELAQLQAGEEQLLRLQETLNKNLQALTTAETLEGAVHSLTAAVHLLSARSHTEPRALRLPPRETPGQAA
jgi:biopolymer transport protein ExbB/TolQ